jgi:hypothetical protein
MNVMPFEGRHIIAMNVFIGNNFNIWADRYSNTKLHSRYLIGLKILDIL